MEEELWSVTYTKDVNRKRNQRQKVACVCATSDEAPGAHKLMRRAALCACATAEPRCSTAQKKTAVFVEHRYRSPLAGSWRERNARSRRAT